MRLRGVTCVLALAALPGCVESSSHPGAASPLANTLCEGLVRPVPALEPSECAAPQDIEQHCRVRVATSPENPAHALRPDGADYVLDANGRVTLEGGETYVRDYGEALTVTDRVDGSGCVASRELVYQPVPGMRWIHESSPADPPRCELEVREGELLTRYADERCQCEPGAVLETRRFDGQGRLVEHARYHEGQLAIRVTRRHDARGNELEVASDLDGDGLDDHTETFTYDGQDRLLSRCEVWANEIGAPVRCTSIVHDDVLRTVTSTSADGTRVDTYDEAGRLVHVQLEGGQEFVIDRDARGLRLSERHLADGQVSRSVTWTRDAAGRPLHVAHESAARASGSEDFAYDAQGRVVHYEEVHSNDGRTRRCARTFTYEGEDCPVPDPQDEEQALPQPLLFLQTACSDVAE